MGGRLLAIAAFLLLSGCAIERAATANQARSDVVGMTKAEVLACAGIPSQTIKEGSTEIIAYQYQGEVQVFSSSTGEATATRTSSNTVSASGSGFSSGRALQRQCTANFVLEGGRVTKLNYSGRTGGLLTQGETCAFIVKNCVAQ